MNTKYDVGDEVWSAAKINLKSYNKKISLDLHKSDSPSMTGFEIRGPIRVSEINISHLGTQYKCTDDFTYTEDNLYPSFTALCEFINEKLKLNINPNGDVKFDGSKRIA